MKCLCFCNWNIKQVNKANLYLSLESPFFIEKYFPQHLMPQTFNGLQLLKVISLSLRNEEFECYYGELSKISKIVGTY
jgi:hypothetical protein